MKQEDMMTSSSAIALKVTSSCSLVWSHITLPQV